MTDHELMAANSYMTIATAGADGTPWVSPVWFAPWGEDRLVWVSDPNARHSRNIAARPEVAIVVFDSTVPVGAAEAVYLRAAARELHDAELEDGIAAFSEHCIRGGIPPWPLERVTAPAKHRLYCATVVEAWELGAGDERIPLRGAGGGP
jgi:nitroimidazol reductase NimA-like FMN-containing flavoprotein (pyridoxamine 5'-phosphate oxidase superfamily)